MSILLNTPQFSSSALLQSAFDGSIMDDSSDSACFGISPASLAWEHVQGLLAPTLTQAKTKGQRTYISAGPATPSVDWAKCYCKSRSEQDNLHDSHGEEQHLQRYIRARDVPWRIIRVLILSWEDDDNDFELYIANLEKVFMCIYNFPTHWFKIPSQNPKDFVEEKVQWFKAQCSAQGELLILYYGGHGGFQGDNEMALSPYEISREDKVSVPYILWDDLLATLEHPKDLEILVLMDCCFAAGSIRSGYIPAASSGGVIEVIAACGFETKSYGGAISFTHALIEELISKASDGKNVVFSTLDLHMGILQRTLRNRVHSHEVRTPVFMRLRQHRCSDSSILLRGPGEGDGETWVVEGKIWGELRDCEREFWDTNVKTRDCEACGGNGRMHVDVGGGAEKSLVGWGNSEAGDEVEKLTPERDDLLPVTEDDFGDGLEEF